MTRRVMSSAFRSISPTVEVVDEAPSRPRTVRQKHAVAPRNTATVTYVDAFDGRRKTAKVKQTFDKDLILAAQAEVASKARRHPNLDQLLMEVQPLIHRVAQGVSRGEKALAQDIAQDSTIKLMRRLEAFRHDAPFAAWVVRLTRNSAIDTLRKKSPEMAAFYRRKRFLKSQGREDEAEALVRPTSASLDTLSSETTRAERAAAMRAAFEREQEEEREAVLPEVYRALAEGLPKLSASQRAVLEARHPAWFGDKGAPDRSMGEVAEMTGHNVKTAGAHLFMAKKKLKSITGIVLPVDARGASRRKNPGRKRDIYDPYSYMGKEVIYVETRQDVLDLWSAREITKAQRDTLLEALA